jgi:hypothetical protein
MHHHCDPAASVLVPNNSRAFLHFLFCIVWDGSNMGMTVASLAFEKEDFSCSLSLFLRALGMISHQRGNENGMG